MRPRSPLIFTFLFVALLPTVDAQRAPVGHFERIDVGGLADKSQSRLTFVAFGQQFDITLEPNDRLVAKLAPQAALRDIALFRGSLVGRDGSWVRLTRSPGRVSGLIWDDEQLYEIAPAGDVAGAAVGAPAAGTAGTVIFASAQTPTGLGDLLVGSVANGAVANAPPVPVLEATLLAPPKQIDVGIVGDFEFASAHRSFATAYALEIMNNVDAIFLRQLGVYLNVVTIEMFDTDTDPFTTADPQQLLFQLANHKENTAALRALGLVHLFTLRDLSEPSGSSRQIVGTANLGSVCDVRTSVSLTQATFAGSVNTAIAAHEIGHNFGAPHDGEAGSPCASTPTTFLMAPTVTETDQFSACSIAQMQPEILGARCLTPVPLADVEVRPPGPAPAAFDVRLGGGGQLSATVTNVGATDALAVEVSVEAALVQVARFFPPAAQNGIEVRCDTANLRCQILRLPPGQSLHFAVEFAAPVVGSGSLSFIASSANDADFANDRFDYAITVVPAVDVDFVDASSLSSRTRYLRPLDTTTLQFDVINRSPIPATNVLLTINMNSLLPLEVADPARDGCVALHTRRWTCAIGSLASFETKQVAVTLRAPAGSSGDQSVSLQLSSTEPDTDQDDSASVFVRVVASLVDLALSLPQPPPVTGGQPLEAAGTLTNRGPDDATDVELGISSFTPGLLAVSTGRGPCTISPNSSLAWVCRLATLAAGETTPLTITAGLRGTYRLDLHVSARETDGDDSDNSLAKEIRLDVPEPNVLPPPPTPSPSSSGGGGGGATDAALLALLAASWLGRALLVRRRERQRHDGRRGGLCGGGRAAAKAPEDLG